MNIEKGSGEETMTNSLESRLQELTIPMPACLASRTTADARAGSAPSPGSVLRSPRPRVTREPGRHWWFTRGGRLGTMPTLGARLLAGVAVGGAALLVIQMLPGRDPTPARTSPRDPLSAQAVLLAAAVGAEKVPPSSGRYWHISSETEVLLPTDVDPKTHSWTVHPGQKYRIYKDHDDTWLAAAEPDHSWEINAPWYGEPCALQFTGVKLAVGAVLSPADLRRLPSDPGDLKAYLLAAVRAQKEPAYPPMSAPPGAPASWSPPPAPTPGTAIAPPVGSPQEDHEVFYAASKLLDAPVEPAVRSAAYRLLAALPSMTLLGEVRDSLGRTGIGIAEPMTGKDDPWGSRQRQIILNATTGDLLGWRTVLHQRGAETPEQFTAGTVLYQTAVRSAGWTDQAPPNVPSRHCQAV